MNSQLVRFLFSIALVRLIPVGVLFFTPSLVLRLALSKMTYYLYLNISA